MGSSQRGRLTSKPDRAAPPYWGAVRRPFVFSSWKKALMSYPSYPPYDSYGGGDEYADPGSGLDDPDEAGGSGLDDLDEAGGGDGSGTGDGGLS